MKTDKVLDRLTKRLDNLIRGGGSSPSTSGRWDLTGKTTISQQELDDIETEQYGEPHRFSDYRLARAKKTAPAIGLTYEDVYDTITQEELDWELRQQLKVSPEDRYQNGKYHWYSHPSSWYKRVPYNGYDGFGCTGQGCITECRYYSETGRIEDSEVIQNHREREKRYRDNNAIVEPPHSINEY